MHDQIYRMMLHNLHLQLNICYFKKKLIQRSFFLIYFSQVYIKYLV